MTDTLDLGSWCILSMASADTVPIADSLAQAGFTVWTPIERIVGLTHRRSQDRRQAILPSFVFAAAHQVAELQRIANSPARHHRRFRVFKWDGGYPLVADRELDALRREEQRRGRIIQRLLRRGRKGPVLVPGSVLRLTDGAFAGLTGRVRSQNGQFTLVDIPGWALPLKIASVMLPDFAVEEQNRAA